MEAQSPSSGHRLPSTTAPAVTLVKSAAVAVLALALTTFGLSGIGIQTSFAETRDGRYVSAPEARVSARAFHDQMRKLWEDHITWTRLTIVSFAASLPDLALTEQRLLRNQDDIGNAFRPFYGDAAADRLTALLREHIIGAANLLAAAKSGDAEKVAAAKRAWYANGQEIADFLSELNPKNWPRGEMRTMFRQHLDLTLQEATHRLQGNFAADIADYDEVHRQILKMADMLSDGIIAQFPDRFRTRAHK